MTSARRPGAARSEAAPIVVVIGTFDTKAAELGALSDEIERLGGIAIMLDTSARTAQRPSDAVIGTRRFIDQATVAAAAGSSIAAISELPRGEAVSALRSGVSRLLSAMVAEGEIDGAVCMGGAGTHIAGPALQYLPFGFPKLIVSPLASGNRTFDPYVGISDIAVLHSVADIIGINSVTSEIYRSAAGYIVGAAAAAALAAPTADAGQRPITVAVSMNGNTTPALERAQKHLEGKGFGFVAFHANGTGGRALENAVQAGQVDAVIDFTTTELSGHLIGGLMDPGPHRMEAAGKAGLPQVLVPGCVDFITCGKLADTQRQFPGRTYFGHNPELTLVRLTTSEMMRVAETFAAKANNSVGPTRVYVPTAGLSVPNAPGQVFWDPEADRAFTTVLESCLEPNIELTKLDVHINDPAFIDHILADFVPLLESRDRHAPSAAPAEASITTTPRGSYAHR
ncbi:Tm-1-like ATP-binding domain-containing protein [Rhodococcus sp. NPDC057529]|uniref:Tm-1-like ATP-binding domain-containing protein n=1 Tax=Rhodococcus sp. NPDC057529 TaxID=3346158 RepID=UPI00366B52D7